MITLARSLDINVCPYARKERMFSKFDRVCTEISKNYPLSYRDPYVIRVDILRLCEVSTFNEAMSSALRYNPTRRFLAPMELLSLNFVDEASRASNPIYSLDFCLLNEVEDSNESPELAVSVWTINPTSYYRGNALRAGDCFATTPCTGLEVTESCDMAALEKLLAMEFSLSESPSQVPRLTA